MPKTSKQITLSRAAMLTHYFIDSVRGIPGEFHALKGALLYANELSINGMSSERRAVMALFDTVALASRMDELHNGVAHPEYAAQRAAYEVLKQEPHNNPLKG